MQIIVILTTSKTSLHIHEIGSNVIWFMERGTLFNLKFRGQRQNKMCLWNMDAPNGNKVHVLQPHPLSSCDVSEAWSPSLVTVSLPMPKLYKPHSLSTNNNIFYRISTMILVQDQFTPWVKDNNIWIHKTLWLELELHFYYVLCYLDFQYLNQVKDIII